MSRARPLPDPVLLVVFDFDGVFTDNKVYTAQDGTETVMCDRRDGLGVKMLRERGIDMFILSLEANPVVEARARKLGLDVEPAHADSPRGGRQIAGDHAHRGRLASAVRPQETEHFPAPDLERNTVNGPLRTERLGQVFHLYHEPSR